MDQHTIDEPDFFFDTDQASLESLSDPSATLLPTLPYSLPDIHSLSSNKPSLFGKIRGLAFKHRRHPNVADPHSTREDTSYDSQTHQTAICDAALSLKNALICTAAEQETARISHDLTSSKSINFNYMTYLRPILKDASNLATSAKRSALKDLRYHTLDRDEAKLVDSTLQRWDYLDDTGGLTHKSLEDARDQVSRYFILVTGKREMSEIRRDQILDITSSHLQPSFSLNDTTWLV